MRPKNIFGRSLPRTKARVANRYINMRAKNIFGRSLPRTKARLATQHTTRPRHGLPCKRVGVVVCPTHDREGEGAGSAGRPRRLAAAPQQPTTTPPPTDVALSLYLHILFPLHFQA